jgi:isocitrate/isopropylmalate dehydrogenase
MMLDWLGLKHGNQEAKQAATLIDEAIDAVLLEGRCLTYDLGGNSRTDEVGDAVVRKMETLAL